MNAAKQKDLFENCGAGQAVLQLAFPTVIGQIILVVYNMADTFFVGLSGNDAMLTAVTICMPAFMFLSAISNLFGVGGASVISRALGSGDYHRAPLASSFAALGCLAVSLLYTAAVFLLRHPFVDLLGGTDPEVHRCAVDYLECAVAAGGGVTAMSGLLAHLIRSEGRAIHASAGIAMGGILNIALDPLFMFVLLPPGQEALGAAVATALSNLISLLYFIIVLIMIRSKTHLRLILSRRILSLHIPFDVFNAGVPACVMTLFENVSYAVLDKLMSLSGIAMQAGIGVAKKVNMLAHCMTRGIAHGSLPLIGYNFSAGNFPRMRRAVRVSHGIAVGMAGLCMLCCLIFSRSLISVFIHTQSPSLDYGTVFLRILCLGGPFSASAYTVISFFQATGHGKRSFLLAILRKGLLDIPLMLVLSTALPIYGIVAATPITDVICCLASQLTLASFLRSLPAEKTEPVV